MVTTFSNNTGENFNLAKLLQREGPTLNPEQEHIEVSNLAPS